MRKITSYFVFILCSVSVATASAKEFTGMNAEKLIHGAEKVITGSKSDVPEYIQFRKGSEIPVEKFNSWAKQYFNLTPQYGFSLLNEEKDQIGMTHYRYQETFNGAKLEGTMFLVHAKNNLIVSMNGSIFTKLNVSTGVSINETSALSKALDFVHADVYHWQIPQNEKQIQQNTTDPNASWFPKGEVMYAPLKGNFNSSAYRLAYRFDVYADKPLSRQYVFIDATTGEVIYTVNRIKNANTQATAVTAYSGTVTMRTDSVNATTFRLRETGRGQGIETYNLQGSTNYVNTDFTDADNFWNNVNAALDQYASDAHWGAEKTYDFYMTKFNRNSIDNAGFKLLNYVHYGNNFVNAFWDGTEMTFGDGDTTYSPLTALDVEAHEITHGVTERTSNLGGNEAGALNESFSDCMGTSIRYFGTNPTSYDWLIGDQLGGTPFRSMSNPKSLHNPDTYLGTYWDAVNQEVHKNSTVMSYWYYLISMGGSGTNDNGDAYNISALGIDTAAAICFRMNTVYLFPNAAYADARQYAIQAAIDLYGPCTNAVIQTTNAWHAVGVGALFSPVVTSDFVAASLIYCTAPATVTFSNLSTNAGYFTWDFGDGSPVSTANNPTHIYNTYGQFTVSLISDGASCGIDSLTRTQYISVDLTNPCIISLPNTGTGITQTTCIGQLYDNGGPSANYTDQTTNQITIAPAGASTVTLSFSAFRLEDTYDFLYIYDGPTTASPLIGSYTGTTLPNGGTISSTGSSITLRQTSDQAVNDIGFALTWQCSLANVPPGAAFSANNSTSCTGTVQFNDNSTNGPTTWSWDFGDLTGSGLQNPSHTYSANGVYTVKLVVTNTIGADSLTQTNYITINLPSAPTATPASTCLGTSAALSASGSSILTWYDSSAAGNALDTGNVFNTPAVTGITTYYVESDIYSAPQQVGPVDNTFGGGSTYTNTNYHDLIFDCLAPVKLVSVKVYASTAGNRTITLIQNGVTIQTATVNIPAGTSRVTLNFNVPVGTNLELGCQGTTNFYRNNAGAVFPYTLSGLISITGTNAGQPGFYYYFYDWEIQTPPCVSPRVPVVASITAGPTAAYNSVLSADMINLTNQSTNAVSWLWNFGDPNSGVNNISQLQNPTHTFSNLGNYNVCLTVTDASGCNDSTCLAVQVTQLGLPGIENSGISIYPNPAHEDVYISFGNNATQNGSWKIKLTDVLGKVIMENYIGTVESGKKYEMNLSAFAPGVYVVSLENNTQKMVSKIFKQ